MMARRPLAPGTYGEISIWEEARKGRPSYRAQARFRDADGRTRAVIRYGQTKARARDTLKGALAARQQTHTESDVNGKTTVDALATIWLRRDHDWTSGTRETYEGVVERQVAAELGAMRLEELRPSVINAALTRVMQKSGPGAAKTTRTVLAGMFDLAIDHDALQANPARGTMKIRRPPRSAVRALTVREAEDLCDKLRADGRATELDLPDLVEWMLGTGARIGEACAAREQTVDLEHGTWEVDSTVKRVKGVGLVIQPRPKTRAGWRVLALPSFCVDMVARRAEELRLGKVAGVVFGSPVAHMLRDPSNTAGDLRETLDRLGFDWVHSHVFRKTVATRLDEAGLSARQIADQLGHKKPSLTQDVYMGRNVVSAEAARILER